LKYIHLRIHHAFKETSYLTDVASIPLAAGNATTIGDYYYQQIAPSFVGGFDWFNQKYTRRIRHGQNQAG
jgi:hypothetical protein